MTSLMETVFLSLGSNLGDRKVNMEKSIEMLRPFLNKIKVSCLYETEPMGDKDAPWFLNAVVRGETELTANDLFKKTSEIEKTLGRVRPDPKPNSPRTIDIDILFYGSHIIKTPELVVPHPRLHERMFVLRPLADISKKFHHPVLKKTVWELFAECKDSLVVNLFVH